MDRSGAPAQSAQAVPPPSLPAVSRLLRSALIAALLAAVALAFAWVRGGLGSAEDSRPGDIVDTQQGGAEPRHAGVRRAHARGLCVSGRFLASGEAAALSSARVFAPGQSPLIGRLSVGGGDPAGPEATAGVRSLALAIAQADGQQWRMAMNTPPVLPVATPQAFHAQLRAMAPDPATGRPDPQRLAGFFAAHPESAAFRAWQAQYRASDSWATTRYHAANAFVLVDAEGRRQPVRWLLEPEQAGAPLPEGPHAADALSREFLERLARGPVRWTLRLQLAEPGDAVDDPSRPWPPSRRQVDAGVVELAAAHPGGGACDGLSFDPLVLPRGIRPSADPILHARRAAYAESLRRRAAEVRAGAGR
ncbi:MAG: catalase family peroxidase [Pseudoxanthomonas sp.]|nr:catalase family peroxidase [Pseudoxanthomonas sp.]